MVSKGLIRLSAYIFLLIVISVTSFEVSADPKVSQASGGRGLLVDLMSGSATELISVTSNGTQGNSWSLEPLISGDGRYVVFTSIASNLVPGDTNTNVACDWDPNSELDNCPDIFVHDRMTGQTERVSINSEGIEGNNSSMVPSISNDGRYVVFNSNANNLVIGDTNDTSDIFVHDRTTRLTELVSKTSSGIQANGGSHSASISGDGSSVAFTSNATNLSSIKCHVFMHDFQTKKTECVALASDGTPANNYAEYPSISADGRYVAFQSGSTNLDPRAPHGFFEIYVHDRQVKTTEVVSLTSEGKSLELDCLYPSISADGRIVTFECARVYSENSQIYVHDRDSGKTDIVSKASDGTVGYEPSNKPAVSASGQYIVFQSSASNLSDEDSEWRDVFVYDRYSRELDLVSHTSSAEGSNGNSYSPSISDMGDFVAFWSFASNLVNGDTNDEPDIFVHQQFELKKVFIPITSRP